MPAAPRVPAREADREKYVGLLREHFAQGRLDAAELDRRVGLVLSAEFSDEAAAALDCLPSLVPVGRPRRFRKRGHAAAAAPEPGWVPTGELSREPRGTVMRVWVDPADQSRHYIPESPD